MRTTTIESSDEKVTSIDPINETLKSVVTIGYTNEKLEINAKEYNLALSVVNYIISFLKNTEDTAWLKSKNDVLIMLDLNILKEINNLDPTPDIATESIKPVNNKYDLHVTLGDIMERYLQLRIFLEKADYAKEHADNYNISLMELDNRIELNDYFKNMNDKNEKIKLINKLENLKDELTNTHKKIEKMIRKLNSPLVMDVRKIKIKVDSKAKEIKLADTDLETEEEKIYQKKQANLRREKRRNNENDELSADELKILKDQAESEGIANRQTEKVKKQALAIKKLSFIDEMAIKSLIKSDVLNEACLLEKNSKSCKPFLDICNVFDNKYFPRKEATRRENKVKEEKQKDGKIKSAYNERMGVIGSQYDATTGQTYSNFFKDKLAKLQNYAKEDADYFANEIADLEKEGNEKKEKIAKLQLGAEKKANYYANLIAELKKEKVEWQALQRKQKKLNKSKTKTTYTKKSKRLRSTSTPKNLDINIPTLAFPAVIEEDINILYEPRNKLESLERDMRFTDFNNDFEGIQDTNVYAEDYLRNDENQENQELDCVIPGIPQLIEMGVIKPEDLKVSESIDENHLVIKDTSSLNKISESEKSKFGSSIDVIEKNTKSTEILAAPVRPSISKKMRRRNLNERLIDLNNKDDRDQKKLLTAKSQESAADLPQNKMKNKLKATQSHNVDSKQKPISPKHNKTSSPINKTKKNHNDNPLSLSDPVLLPENDVTINTVKLVNNLTLIQTNPTHNRSKVKVTTKEPRIKSLKLPLPNNADSPKSNSNSDKKRGHTSSKSTKSPGSAERSASRTTSVTIEEKSFLPPDRSIYLTESVGKRKKYKQPEKRFTQHASASLSDPLTTLSVVSSSEIDSTGTLSGTLSTTTSDSSTHLPKRKSKKKSRIFRKNNTSFSFTNTKYSFFMQDPKSKKEPKKGNVIPENEKPRNDRS